MGGELEERLLNGDLEQDDNGSTKQTSWRENFTDIVQLAGPAILQLSFQQAVIVTNQSMAGHLGPDALAAAAIAVTWFNLMWFFIIGASSALDTLGSQAFGAGDRPGVIMWAVSATGILSILAIPMAVALYFGDSVAETIFQQSPEISSLVGIYCRGILPGLWPFIWSLVIMKAMQAQNMMWGPTLVTIGMFVANIFINMAFIKAYGFTGAAYAQSASRIALFLFLIGFVCTAGKGCVQFERAAWHVEDENDPSTSRAIRTALQQEADYISDTEASPLMQSRVYDSAGSTPPCKSFAVAPDEVAVEEDPPFSETTLLEVVKEGLSKERMLLFLQLGVAGGLMMAADASSFDITTAMAGFIGVEEVGAHTSLLTIIEFIFTSFPYGIATAATIRVGNMLGAGRPTAARRSAYLCLGVCACFNIIVMVLFFVFGDKIGYIFTNDSKVVHLVAKLSILGGLYQIPDCIYGSISGILRGTGRQASLMASNLLGFWVCGMPACYLLAFTAGLGVEGLWIGLIIGLSSSALFVTIMLLMLNWEKEAEKAQQMVLAMRDTEEDDEIAGGDIFQQPAAAGAESGSTGTRRGQAEVARNPAMHHVASTPLPMRRSVSQPALVASLTGSYARPRNSHL